MLQDPCTATLAPSYDLLRIPSDRTDSSSVDTNLRVMKMAGDGRCMFRALAQGLARLQGRILRADMEEQEADQLRLAVAEALCRGPPRRNQFGDAVIALEAEDKLPK